MASLQEPGVLSIYIVAPSGARRLVKAANSAWWSPGGTADGVVANTPEKWNFLPLSPHRGSGGYALVFEFTAAGADGIDASDCAFQLPVMVNGNLVQIGNTAHTASSQTDNFTVDFTFADYTTVAGQTAMIYKLRAKEGVIFQVGGDRTNCGIEDDTA